MISIKNETIIMTPPEVAAALKRIAGEILAAHRQEPSPCLVGIRTGGAFLARRLQKLMEDQTRAPVPTGIIDINLYRDDWTTISHKPIVGQTHLNFSIEDRIIVLVDDVLYTGRTVRAALDALMDFGRPARIELAVLADRGRRELPICPDYAGLVVESAPEERINVYLSEQGYEDVVTVAGRGT
jgi:pyrimidine operon attenuation protein/uracil phosphoribosyltransferase